MSRPAELAVTVHSLDQALIAAETAQAAGAALHLESAPGAGGAAGLGWWLQLCRIVLCRFPALPIVTVLDCADEPGTVLAALRRGVTRVRYQGVPAILAKLTQIARGYGAAIEAGEAHTLDLRCVADVSQACRERLAEGTAEAVAPLRPEDALAPLRPAGTSSTRTNPARTF